MSLILTKAALALQNAENNFQVVKYESHKPKRKTLTEGENKAQLQDKLNNKKESDLKRIRHEVVKFGMSGFDSMKKEEAKIALAVSLGAKPPKRAYVNYKELMANRKEEKRRQKEEKQQMISRSVIATGNKKKKQQKNDVGRLLSSYGKVQSKELKKKASKGPTKKKQK